MERMLLEFPVFALNDDYLRAIANILFSKVDTIVNLLNNKNKLLKKAIESTTAAKRDKQL